MRKKLFSVLIMMALGGMFFGGSAQAALYTPYTGMSVTPGEMVEYTVEVLNDSSAIQHTSFDMRELPDDWSYTLTANGRQIQRLSVKPNDSEEVQLEIEIPLEVDKGDYELELVAEGNEGDDSLPLTVTVSEEGTFATEFQTEQPNMEGHADSTFTFQAELRNRTAEEQHYALSSSTERGWDVQFIHGGDTVTSVTLEPNTSADLEIEVTPPENVQADTYTIPVQAATSSTSAELELEVVVSGTYDMEFSTPSGNLSTEITAGDERTLQLQVTNTGTGTLRDVELEASAPTNWEVEFETSELNPVEAGESTTVNATIKASEDAIAGDYMVSMSATSPEVSSEADIRVSVTTSVWWGLIGVIIIVAVLGGIYYLFRTYGRR